MQERIAASNTLAKALFAYHWLIFQPWLQCLHFNQSTLTWWLMWPSQRNPLNKDECTHASCRIKTKQDGLDCLTLRAIKRTLCFVEFHGPINYWTVIWVVYAWKAKGTMPTANTVCLLTESMQRPHNLVLALFNFNCMFFFISRRPQSNTVHYKIWQRHPFTKWQCDKSCIYVSRLFQCISKLWQKHADTTWGNPCHSFIVLGSRTLASKSELGNIFRFARCSLLIAVYYPWNYIPRIIIFSHHPEIYFQQQPLTNQVKSSG